MNANLFCDNDDRYFHSSMLGGYLNLSLKVFIDQI